MKIHKKRRRAVKPIHEYAQRLLDCCYRHTMEITLCVISNLYSIIISLVALGTKESPRVRDLSIIASSLFCLADLKI